MAMSMSSMGAPRRRAIAFDEPTTWQAEDAVSLWLDDTLLFEGRIKETERRASREEEWVAYTCLGARGLANAIPFRRTIGGTATARVVYNCPTEEADCEVGFVALSGPSRTVGEIVADILDAMAPELAGIIGDGSPGSGYIQAELDALAVVPPKLVLCGHSVDEALRAALRHAPNFAFLVDPASHIARFLDLRTAPSRDIPGLAEAVLRHNLVFSTADCYSACTLEGDLERVDILEELTPAWDEQLEPSWTPEKASQFPDTYGAVWRLFDTAEPVEMGALVAEERFVGSGRILAFITYQENGQSKTKTTSASVVDDTRLLLDDLAREWYGGAYGGYLPATVHARFTYLKGRISARYPPSGHTGSAHARRGLTRELAIVDHERGKKSIKGNVHQVLSPARFSVLFPLALDGELAGTTVEFNADGIAHTIASNGASTITLAATPQNPIQPGDQFVITVQDDTAKRFHGGTMSALELLARERLEQCMDERTTGTVPLSGLDWTLSPGLRVNFTGTNDPDYASLGAHLVAVEHALAHQRTILSLTSERAGGFMSWQDLQRERRQDLDAEELNRQLRRLWRRARRRRRLRIGPAGDPHILDDEGPYTGDATWTAIGTDKLVRHIGPGPADRTIGGSGHYIQWITLDARCHVLDAGAGTFS